MPRTSWPSSIVSATRCRRRAPDTVRPGATTTSPSWTGRSSTAQAELADADAALQTASPNYGQLVQQVVPAADVLATLRPDEALAAITLTTHGGWSFLLRAGSIDAAPVKGDTASITALVKRVRSEHRIAYWSAAEIRHGGSARTLRRDARACSTRLAGAKALVVAPSGSLLSLPFALLLTGPAIPMTWPTRPGSSAR